jgi:hypothetical protein
MAKTSEFRLSRTFANRGTGARPLPRRGWTGNVGGETVRSVVTPNGSSRTICFLAHRRSVAAPLISRVLDMATSLARTLLAGRGIKSATGLYWLCDRWEAGALTCRAVNLFWFRLQQCASIRTAGRWAGSSPCSRNLNFVEQQSGDLAQEVIMSDVPPAKRCYHGWFHLRRCQPLPVQHGGGRLPHCRRAWAWLPPDFTTRQRTM